MATKQINLKISKNLYDVAESFAESYGYRNVQELAADSLREKIFEREYDNSFTQKEIELIDRLIEKTLEKKDFVEGKDVFKALK
jgi:hypothetical protein